MIDNTPAAPQPGPAEGNIENTERPREQATGFTETERHSADDGGEVNEQQPSWRPGDDPTAEPVTSGMQSEGEPGRSQRDSTGGVEGPIQEQE